MSETTGINVEGCRDCYTPVCLDCRPPCEHGVVTCPEHPGACDECRAHERRWAS